MIIYPGIYIYIQWWYKTIIYPDLPRFISNFKITWNGRRRGQALRLTWWPDVIRIVGVPGISRGAQNPRFGWLAGRTFWESWIPSISVTRTTEPLRYSLVGTVETQFKSQGGPRTTGWVIESTYNSVGRWCCYSLSWLLSEYLNLILNRMQWYFNLLVIGLGKIRQRPVPPNGTS